MFLNEYEDKEVIRDLIIQHLRNIGIKYRLKKQVLKHISNKQIDHNVFKTPLHLLPVNTISMTGGVQVEVPQFVNEACNAICSNLQIEGLFRKAGSSVRQKEIRQTLDNGGELGTKHHVIDIANILKLFFRELPEPLILYSYHDLFLHCLRIKDKSIQCILLVCLLLPIQHLNTLTYFMKFLKQVSINADKNKMDVNNLAIIITPSIMPVEDNVKISNHSSRLKYHVEVIKILIENSQYIGLVPDCILEKLTSYVTHSNEELNIHLDEDKKKKKKRRSGSLTRMINGLKKIMSGKSNDEEAVKINFLETPDLLSTPCLLKSSKKRKGNETNGLSSKKKSHENFSVKRSYLALSSRRLKNKQISASDGESNSAFSRFERRLSFVSNATGWGKKKRNSDNPPMKRSPADDVVMTTEIPKIIISEQCSIESSEPDYVRIPKSEYEEIKNRVSAIENRISQEFNNIAQQDPPLSKEISEEPLSRAKEVQTQYEKTLVEADSLINTSTDQLAKRLSRELKIRRPSDQKVIRSPSARKIGTIRRRSREFDKKHNSRLTRNKSWHIQKSDCNNSENQNTFTRSALRRGRPNTVFTGLPQPSPNLMCLDSQLCVTTSLKHLNLTGSSDSPSHCTSHINITPDHSSNNETQQKVKVSFGNITKCTVNRASSFHGDTGNNAQYITCNSNLSARKDQMPITSLTENWQSAEQFFETSKQNTLGLLRNQNDRSSLARLRSQNAGMVLAKTKLFDGLSDSSENSKSSQNNSVKKERVTVIRSKMNTAIPNRNNRRPSSRFPRHSAINNQCKNNLTVKISTPRRKQGMKSPNSVQRQHKLKLARQKNIEFDSNQIITPKSEFAGAHLEFNKENSVKISSNGVDKISVSPLKDCNRLDKIQFSPNATPKTTPRIKKPLGVKSPRHFSKTPQRIYERKSHTPLKAIHDLPISSITKRQSPRLLILQSKHISSAC